MTTFYAIGHGSRPVEEFLALLAERGVRTLVDVRARPGSTRHPQYAQEKLRRLLEAAGVQYHWAGRQLGGFRAPRSDSRHTALADDGLRGFADHMEGDDFQRAVRQLANLAAQQGPLAFMCAERDPAHCHRSLIADALVLRKCAVVHLLGAGADRPHALNSRARIESNHLVYDLAS
jgi:uncharacterized protein (DUF488 family)